MGERTHTIRYALRAYRALPVTFLRRVLFGRDSYWKQYFWSRWGYPPRVVRKTERPVLWIDALSGGEITQIVTFCKRLRLALPHWTIVLSTNNKYSFDFARSHIDVDLLMDTPWDLSGPVRRALRRVQPKVFISIQNVYCPVLVREAHRSGVTTILASAVMRDIVKRHPMLWRTIEINPFAEFDWVGAWSARDVDELADLGTPRERAKVTGNMKFDLDFLHVSDDEIDGLREDLGIGPDEPVLLAANVHPGEEELVGRAYVQAQHEVPDLRLVVVPRYASNTDQAASALGSLGLASIRRTQLSRGASATGRVVLVDTFGELGRLYAISSVVFLAGTLYERNVVGLGQSPIEALAHRKIIFFGKFMNLWREITDGLKTVWPEVEVTTSEELANGIIRVLTDQGLAEAFDQHIGRLLDRHGEDVERTVDLVLQAVGVGSQEGAPVSRHA